MFVLSLIEDNFEKLFQNDIEQLDQAKIIESFYTNKNINMKTDLPKQSIIMFAVLEAYTDEMKRMGLKSSARFLKKIISLLKEMLVSGNREGRKEAIAMLNAVKEQMQKTSTLGKILGVDQ